MEAWSVFTKDPYQTMNVVRMNGGTLLHCFASITDDDENFEKQFVLKVIHKFPSAFKSIVDMKDAQGNTALHVLCKKSDLHNRFNALLALSFLDANPEVRDAELATPVMLVNNSSLFLTTMIRLFNPNLRVKDVQGNTALHRRLIKLSNGFPTEDVEVVKVLIDNGSNWNTANDKGVTCRELTRNMLKDVDVKINKAGTELDNLMSFTKCSRIGEPIVRGDGSTLIFNVPKTDVPSTFVSKTVVTKKNETSSYIVTTMTISKEKIGLVVPRERRFSDDEEEEEEEEDFFNHLVEKETEESTSSRKKRARTTE